MRRRRVATPRGRALPRARAVICCFGDVSRGSRGGALPGFDLCHKYILYLYLYCICRLRLSLRGCPTVPRARRCPDQKHEMCAQHLLLANQWRRAIYSSRENSVAEFRGLCVLSPGQGWHRRANALRLGSVTTGETSVCRQSTGQLDLDRELSSVHFHCSASSSSLLTTIYAIAHLPHLNDTCTRPGSRVVAATNSATPRAQQAAMHHHHRGASSASSLR